MKYITKLSFNDVREHLLKGGTLQTLMEKTPTSQYEQVTEWYNLLQASYNATADLIERAYAAVLKYLDNNVPEDRLDFAHAVNKLSATNETVKEARPFLMLRYDNKPLSRVIWQYLRPKGDKLS